MWAVRKKRTAFSHSHDARGNIIQVSFLCVLIAGALLLVAFIFLPYLAALFLALILSIVFRPLYRFLHRRLRRPSVAAFAAVALVLILIIVPLTFFGILLFNEAYDLYSGGGFSFSENSFVSEINAKIGSGLSRFSPTLSFDLTTLTDRVVGWFFGNLKGFFSKFVDAVIGLFITTLGLFYLFKDGEHVMKRVMFLSPLSDRYDQEIFLKVEMAINSVVRGSLVVALIQGFLSGLGFLIFGLPNPILWASVATLTSLIPNVGTAAVLLPTVAYLFFTGHTAGAAGLLLWGALAVGFIDNLLGPHLIERGIKIHPFLILLSVIGGIGFFGPVGFIAGPVVLSLLFSLLDIYPLIMRGLFSSHR